MMMKKNTSPGPLLLFPMIELTEDKSIDYISLIGDSAEGINLIRALTKDLSADNPILSWSHEGLNTTIKKSDVVRLYLSHINLPSLKLFARSFLMLNTVNVSFNNLKELDSFACFENLLFLDISHNKITSLSFATNLSKLNVLRCQNNLIESLEEVKHMPLLKELWISNNKIQWQQYINLNSLKLLEVFIKSDKEKVSEENAKIDSFVIYLVPSIKCLDGTPVSCGIEQAAISVDVKVMLTQARALLQVSEQHNAESLKKGGLLETQQKKGFNSKSRKKSPSSVVVSKRGVALTDEHITVPDEDNSSLGPRKGQKLPKQDTESQSLPDSSALDDEIVEAAPMEGSGSQKVKSSRSTMAAVRKIPKKFAGPGPSKEPSSKDLEAAVVVKFNSKLEDSPIALSVQSNGEGYMRWVVQNHSLPLMHSVLHCRWSRAGPMACSWEAGRLLACYRASGCVACVFDRRSLSGSVMDPRGRCVLAVNDRSARTLDRAGGTLHEFLRRGAQVAEAAGGSAEECEWSFEGLLMKFDPNKWEVT